MDTIDTVPLDFRVRISLTLGQYWWKRATPPNATLAEKYLAEALQRSYTDEPLHVLSEFYMDQGQPQKAADVAQTLLKEKQEFFGTSADVGPVGRMTNLRRTLEEQRAQLGDHHPKVLKTTFELACWLETHGLIAEAELYLRVVLRDAEPGDLQSSSRDRLIHLLEAQGMRTAEVTKLRNEAASAKM